MLFDGWSIGAGIIRGCIACIMVIGTGGDDVSIVIGTIFPAILDEGFVVVIIFIGII